MGKRILHGFFGMIIGALAGLTFCDSFYFYWIIGGGIVETIAAFFLKDTFWKHIKDFF